nr:hypothetical protein [Streptomyces sp. Ag109_G2-15]
MKKRVAPRVSSAVRGHRRIICVTASAALLVPLLIDRSDGTPSDQLLQDDYTAAANEYQVPRSVLMGVSYLQSRWDSHHGAPSVVGGYGPMHLVDAPRPQPPQTPQHTQGQPRAGSAGPPASRTTNPPADLQQAARLTGLPAEQLRTDDAANVRGGAALLAATQRQLGKPLSPNPGTGGRPWPASRAPPTVPRRTPMPMTSST